MMRNKQRRDFSPSRVWWHHPRQGFTLLEVVISALILATMTLSLIGALTLSSKLTRVNGYAITAKNIAQSYIERMQIDSFDNVNEVNYPNKDENSAEPVWLDQALGIACQVNITFKGFGTLENSSANNLTDAKAAWEKDEWAGNTVYLRGGQADGQFGQIDFNTPNTLHLAEALEINPRKGTEYYINNGKTVQITIRYRYCGKTYSQTVQTLIINKR